MAEAGVGARVITLTVNAEEFPVPGSIRRGGRTGRVPD